MSKPRLLDLCCCAGGAAYGYHLAGFDVTGVDINPQPNYPFNFIQADAVDYLKKHGKEYDVVHASPPCQMFSCSTAIQRKAGKVYPDILEPLRKELIKQGKPYIIENVSNAPLRHDVVLYGYMFGLKVIRKRVFELGNLFVMQPGVSAKPGRVDKGDFVCVYGKAKWANTNDSAKRKTYVKPVWRKETILETWKYAMGIDWKITDREISESIPPAYTRFIGEQIINQINYHGHSR